MSRLLVLSVLLATSASAQQAPQLVVSGGYTTVADKTSLLGAATALAWPSRVGFAVHGEYAERYYYFGDAPSAAAVGVLAAVAFPFDKAEIALMAGPSLSREDVPSVDAQRGWTPGAMGRVQASIPLTGSLALALGAGAVASADGVRPSSTVGLGLRLGR